MTLTAKEAFVTAMATLAGAFNRALSPEALEGYWMGLEDLSAEDFAVATKRALAECQFMPVPVELRAFVRSPRNLTAEAAIAWDSVREAIDRIDYTVSAIDFGPHVNAVIRQLGGWDVLCRAKLTELDVWKRKEFERLYVALDGSVTPKMGEVLDGPEDGQVYGARTVAIAGIPSQPPPADRALPSNGASDISAHIRALADEKAAK